MFINMEEKLASYRQRKANEAKAKQSPLYKLKSFLWNLWKPQENNTSTPEVKKLVDSQEEHSAKEDDKELTVSRDKDAGVSRRKPGSVHTAGRIAKQEGTQFAADEESSSSAHVIWIFRILKFLLWLCLWGLFVELQFGAVYFAVSVLLFAYFNTRTGPKDKSKPSAYSVFNKDCERIGGTLTAEQLQKQMFSVPGLPS